jgi:hypothetical protein
MQFFIIDLAVALVALDGYRAFGVLARQRGLVLTLARRIGSRAAGRSRPQAS